MERSWGVRSLVTPKVTAAILYLSTAASLSCLLLKFPGGPFAGLLSSWESPIEIAGEASPLAFWGASALVFFRPRFGYVMGLVSGLIALTWFVRMEFSPDTWSSWIYLNSDPNVDSSIPAFAKLKILSPALILLAMAISLLRLLPAQWSLRGTSLCSRTWPAFAVSFLAVVAWFVHPAIPYSIPAYNHPANFEFRILHVQKRGL